MGRFENEGEQRRAGETVAEAVRRQLLDAVLVGNLSGPSRLMPAELAQRFGVSITPVREALASLASDGFIEATPRYGYHVRPPNADHVTELWAVRLALELMAGELLLQRFSGPAARASALAPLIRVHAKLGAQATRSHRNHVALNGQFHDQLIALSGNALLQATYAGIRVRLLVGWVQRGSSAWRARLPGEQAEHQAILDALQSGNRAGLDGAIRRHLARSLTDAMTDVAQAVTAQTTTTEETHAETRKDHPGRGAGALAPVPRRRRARRAADDNPNVDLPQPRRDEPARGGAR